MTPQPWRYELVAVGDDGNCEIYDVIGPRGTRVCTVYSVEDAERICEPGEDFDE